ncbi:MAG: aminotransferase class I/II-fold pyridoxal phosphate-dependent enzyme, partial [Alphaproteobacteria bacterium]
EVFRAANERAAAGDDVLHLEVGEPSTGAPKAVIDAVRSALDGRALGYTEALGLRELRARIVRHYAEFYGVEVPIERVAVTTGSSGGFLLAFLSAFDTGDRVALADPSYPAYRNTLSALGITPVALPTGPATRFQPSVEHLNGVDGPIDGLIVASPSNPTGTMLPQSTLAALARECAERGIRLISDEVYHGITYGAPAETVLKFTTEAVVLNSFSKYFAMTGWRLGWMVLPEDLARPVERLAQNLFISPPAPAQYAAIVAFDCREDLDRNVARYARNREILLAELPKAGLDRFAPADGAFYLYVDVSDLTNDSEAFCERMLAETGVAATPGIDFDQARGRAFVRLSFAGATEDMREAVRRLQDWRR